MDLWGKVSSKPAVQGKGVRWAIAGRNQGKLERVRKDLESIEPSVKVLLTRSLRC